MKRKPEWLKVRLQGSRITTDLKNMLETGNLHTVCKEANCPNVMECFEKKSATFIISGRYCTRNCLFCNVTHGIPEPLNPEEPYRISEAVRIMGLEHVVITSVTRDDLADQGAGQFADVVKELKKANPQVSVELLVPDFQGCEELLAVVTGSKPDVLNHNLETVPSLYGLIRPQSDYKRSLRLLELVKKKAPGILTKSGLMVGMGETEPELTAVFNDLAAVDCDILTVGQYLQPSVKHYPVQEFVTPDQFTILKENALEAGIKKVIAGPLVRSSYRAAEVIRSEKEERHEPI